MPAKFVFVDRNSPMLISPDLQSWLPKDHLARFIVDLVEEVSPNGFIVNESGSGSSQFPPLMMCMLLIYCYATGRFSSRKIERATYDDVAVRFITGNTHPDHDTICTFRRRNGDAFRKLFVSVLETAQEMRVLERFGTISIDGTKIKANASKHKAVSYERAGQMILQLETEVDQLMRKAEDADSTPLDDGLSIPDEIARREARIEKLKTARKAIEQRARERAGRELQEKQERHEKRKKDGKRVRGKPKPGKSEPDPKAQYNFTDPESRIMKAGNGKHFEQCYNAQAAVDVNSRLLVAADVTDEPNDKEQLTPVIDSIDADYTPQTVLVDSGYFSAEAVDGTEQDEHGDPTGITVLAATGRKSHHRTVEDIEKPAASPAKIKTATANGMSKQVMSERLSRPENRRLYAQRKQTIEPVFGIIKEAMGFRRFSMRGKSKAKDEWSLVTAAYNIKRLFHLGVSCTPNGAQMMAKVAV